MGVRRKFLEMNWAHRVSPSGWGSKSRSGNDEGRFARIAFLHISRIFERVILETQFPLRSSHQGCGQIANRSSSRIIFDSSQQFPLTLRG